MAAIPLFSLSIYSFAVAYITSGIPFLSDYTSVVASIIIRMLNSIIGYIGS
jgi:hypothetical protein